MENAQVQQDIDFRLLFESAPACFMVIAPNPPHFTIIGASNAYLNATMTRRNEFIGRGLFEVFPDNPDDATADGVNNLRHSLMQVLEKKTEHKMATQRYDIRRPAEEGGEFEVRYWNPTNRPVFENGKITAIIHVAEDVTEWKLSQLRAEEEARITRKELDEKIAYLQNNEERINHILTILLNYTQLDFTEKIQVTESGDELDAIAVGMNTLSEELQSYIQQLSENELSTKLTNDFLNTILENIPNMIFVKDADELRFMRFNKAGEALIGVKKENLLGKNDYDLFPKEQADFFVEKDRETLTNGVLVDIPEETIDTKDGKKVLHTKKIPVRDANGKTIYLLGISEDITEQKAASVELQKYHEQLEVVNRELESFSYSISHDLRAPLRAIHGYSKILEEDYYSKLDDDGKNTITAIMRNSKRMGELIDDLLAFSRLGKKELSTSLTDMTVMVREVCDEVIPKEMRIRVDLKIENLFPAYVDYTLMRQVWTNLISNAIKFSGGNNRIDIHIGCTQGKNRYNYFVKDNGVGFDMRYYDKLFGVFQRLHSQEDFAGTGVGLAIVKRILTKHHGDIWAESEINQGTTFHFSLPIHKQTP